jgi:hypothetical protein
MILNYLLPNLNLGRSRNAAPYDSTTGIDPKVALILCICAILFFIYVAFRVRRALKDDENERWRALRILKRKKKTG